MKKKIIIVIGLIILVLNYYYFNIYVPSQRIYLPLEYSGYAENINFSSEKEFLGISEDGEFTWWEKYSWYDHGYGDNLVSGLYEDYGIELPEIVINEMTDKDLIISFGRKLKALYYYDDLEYMGLYIAKPVFEKEYTEGTVYFYRTNNTTLYPSYLTDDIWIVNVDGKVPFKEGVLD